MCEFIEVTENGKKTLISTSDISKIIRAKKAMRLYILNYAIARGFCLMKA